MLREEQVLIDAVNALIAKYEQEIIRLRSIVGEHIAPEFRSVPPPSSRIVTSNEVPSQGETELESNSLIDAVEGLVKSKPGAIWTAPKVIRGLEDSGFQFQAKRPGASVAAVMRRLQERRIIQLSKKGAGRRPSAYRVSHQDQHGGEP